MCISSTSQFKFAWVFLFFFTFFFFFDCQGRLLGACSACPLSLQPRWNITGKIKIKSKDLKRKILPEDAVTETVGGFMSGVKLTGREKQQNSNERCVCGCGTTWVSTILSLDFSHMKPRAWGPAGGAAEHPVGRLNSPCCELAFLHSRPSAGRFGKRQRLQPCRAIVFRELFI